MKKVILISIIVSFCSCSRNFYIVRHAEKAEVTKGMSRQDASNPELSDVGKQRAYDLRDRLSRKSITRIFTTRYKRTISTIVPISERTGIPVSFYSPAADSLPSFIHHLKTETSGGILIVGHSNTIDDLVNGLCGTKKLSDDISETEYDNLFIVKKRGKKYKLVSKKYGAVSSQR
ncbi:MAG: SixA phosphatase family protein [Agriterribacter sp.]